MARIQVTLADAPTDILVFLAGRPADSYHGGVIATEVAPEVTRETLRTTAAALSLLEEMGCVQTKVVDGTLLFQVTQAGQDAVAAAREVSGG